MKKPNKTSPTSNVVSSDILEKKRRLKELTRPRDCLVVNFSDDLPPFGEPESRGSAPPENKPTPVRDTGEK